METRTRAALWTTLRAILLLLALTGAGTGTGHGRARGDVTASGLVSNASPSEAPAVLPLAFEANVGQADPAARFVARGRGYALALAPDALTLLFAAPRAGSTNDNDPAHPTPAPVRLAFVGENATVGLATEAPLPGVVNYLIGNDPTRWHTRIPTSARVRYTALYPGIDLIVYGTAGNLLEYDALVAPGADPAAFALRITGAQGVTLETETGDLVLTTSAGEVRQRAPVLYQAVGDRRVSVAGGYVVRGDGAVGWWVGKYDATLPLVIDPGIAYATYLGGKNGDAAKGIAVDGAGNVYVTGATTSDNFPVTDGSTYVGGSGHSADDAFVAKLDPNGAVAYATYLGGNGDSYGAGIAVDGAGKVYIAGSTASKDFPVTNGSTYTSGPDTGAYDAFVAKLDPSGGVTYAIYLGGTRIDHATGIVVDGAGNAYVSGLTGSSDFPVTNGSTYAGSGDAFVAKLDASGAVVYAAYLGGSGDDEGNGIAIDANGNIYVTGRTSSRDFPVTNGGKNTGSFNAFVAKLDASGAVTYAAYLGGSNRDRANGIAVDGTGNIYLTGSTNSLDFPVTNGSTHAGNAASDNAFVAKLDPTGAVVYATYLSGTDMASGVAINDTATGIAIDTAGNTYVAGSTNSASFPVTNGSKHAGFNSAFVVKLDANGSVAYATYLGGSANDEAGGIAANDTGIIYVTGFTNSSDFPVTNGSKLLGQSDVFVATLAPGGASG